MVFIVLFLLLWMAMPAHAVIINATGCTEAATVTAWDAANNGDTIQFPVCNNKTTNDWDAKVTLTGTSSTKRGIKFKGMGRDISAGIGTKFWHNASSGALLEFNGVWDLQLSDIEFEGFRSGGEQVGDWGVVCVNCVDFIIYNNRFRHWGIGLRIVGHPLTQRGVVYNNEFIQNTKFIGGGLGYGVFVGYPFTTGSPYPTLALNTMQNVFIEDNYFERNRHSIAAGGGARYVFRYNTVWNGGFNVDTGVGSHHVDAHGDPDSGTRQWEVYHNLLRYDRGGPAAITMRGGDGVVFNNKVVNDHGGSVVTPLKVTIEQSGGAPGCSCQYPCPRQVRNLYMWGNVPTNQVIKSRACDNDFIQEGIPPREYEEFAKPGYTLIAAAMGGEFPVGIARTNPNNTLYPHQLRLDPPGIPPNAPVLVSVTPQ